MEVKAQVYSQDSSFIGYVKSFSHNAALQSFFLYKDSQFSPPLEEHWAENTDKLYLLLFPVDCVFSTFERSVIARVLT